MEPSDAGPAEPEAVDVTEQPAPAARSTRRRTWLSVGWSLVAVVLLWVALVAPYRPVDVEPSALLRLPLEGLVLVAVLLVLPGAVRRPVAVLAGVVLALLCLLKILDLGFYIAFDRPFDPVTDTGYADSGVSLLFDSAGTLGAVLGLVGIAALLLGLLVVLPLAALRVSAVATRNRRRTARTVAVLVAAWTALAVSGVTTGTGAVASTSAFELALEQPKQIREGIAAEQEFADTLREDPLAVAPPRLLSGLRGKDVLLVFVESYGRYAVEGPESAPVKEVLDAGSRRLRAAGFRSRSAFLTSPTFGGISWLAHSTLQSGLWIDSQQRYDRLLQSRRSTLMGLFDRMGWRTVMDIPSSARPWRPGQRFYGFDKMYGYADVGYTGPEFGYAKIPDQYTLEALYRNELAAKRRRPLMAEVDLDSSHLPWVPLPTMVPWDELGNGSIYDTLPAQDESRAEVWSDRDRLRRAYVQSVVYSMRSLLGFVRRYGDDDLVLVVLGDHQPISPVSGQGASHDVPISVIASDPAVMGRIGGWGWNSGLRPEPDAPVWRMDSFRGRFLDAYATPLEPVSPTPR